MKPIRRMELLPLWVLAACGGAEEAPRASGDPGMRAAAAESTALGNTATPDCEDGATSGPDTGDVLSRNEIRTWARPDQPLRMPCKPPSAATVPDVVGQVAVATAEPPASTGSVSQPAQIFPPVEAGSAAAKDTVPRIPLVRGLTIVQTLHFPGGDRESVETIDEVSPAGVRYGWRFVEVHAAGDTVRENYTRFVSTADLAGARRIHLYAEKQGPTEQPSYTWLSISTAVYQQVRAAGSDTFQIMALEPPPGSTLANLGLAPFRASSGVPVRWRGTLTLASASPEPFPLLVDGRRVTVPALRVKGRFDARGNRWEPDIWVLADSAHPLLLKLVGRFTEPANVLQTVRVDLPSDREQSDGKGQPGPSGSMEHGMASACRFELPGIYFEFASAELQPASAPALAGVAELLERHPDWSFSIEGHTDSIGDPISNQTLSQRRAEAVKAELVKLHRISPDRLRPVGFGAGSPREPNSTIEGRARNRRVELVRDCANERG